MISTAIILAGGLGTRLRSAVPNLPKPMAPINDRPFLEYQMAYWIAQGVDNFILSVGYKYEIIIEHFGSSWKGVPIKYVVEQVPLGTGGGLLLAAKELEDPFLVLNGDTFFEVDFKKMKQFHNVHHAEWTFALFQTSEVGRYMGIEVSSSGRVNSLQSNMTCPDRLANGGVYLLEPSILDKYQNSSTEKISLEDDILPFLFSQESRIFGLEQAGRFIDIGLPEDYHRVSEVIII
jgi:D-glycero-alpha-D-manno-heptose 1-phosphate guanylyltransferase